MLSTPAVHNQPVQGAMGCGGTRKEIRKTNRISSSRSSSSSALREEEQEFRGATTTSRTASGSSRGSYGECAVEQVWRVRSKHSFQSILDVVERRSTSSSRCGSVASTASSEGFQQALPFSAVFGGPRNGSSHGGEPGSSDGGEQQAASPGRRRFKSFRLLRQDSKSPGAGSAVLDGVDGDLGVVREPEQEDSPPADLAVESLAAKCVGEVVSAAIARRVNAVGAGSDSGCLVQ